MNTNYYFLVLSILFLFTGCQKESLSSGEQDHDFAIQFTPYINYQIQTRNSNNKNSVLRTVFENGDEIGISVFETNGYSDDLGIEGSKSYGPIPAYRRISTQITDLGKGFSSYWIHSSLTDSTKVNILAFKQGSGKVDAYAYYPYSKNLEKLSRIPFSILGANNYNTAKFNYLVATPVKGIDSGDLSGTDSKHVLTKNLEFKHVMSIFTLSINKKFVGPSLYGTFTLTFSSPKIATSGYYSALDGTITERTKVVAQIVSQFNITDTWVGIHNINLLIPPIESSLTDDTTLELKLEFSGSKELINGTSTFNLKDFTIVNDSGTTLYGLQPNCEYLFKIDLYNYVHFSGLPQISNWTDVITDKFPI